MTTESQYPPTIAISMQVRTPVRSAGRRDNDGQGPKPLPDSVAPDAGLGDNPSDERPAVGSVFLEFRLEEEIGRGTFSRVYLARQQDLADRPVILKITTDAHRESDTLARLQHTNIVPIHSVHRSGSYHAICMPYLGTTTLADVYRGLEGMPTLPNSGRDLFTTLICRRTATVRTDLPAVGRSPAAPPAGPLPILTSLDGLSYVESVLWLIARLANGLAHAHDRGVIHQDLKPANVLLSDDGVPMILDFNLAGEDRSGSEATARGGTPPYMSPEQLDGFARPPQTVDARTDLYSLGVIAYELLTRRNPFPRYKTTDPDSVRAMAADRRGLPPGVQKWNRAVSPAAESIVRHLLEPDPDGRYQSAHEVAEDIERHLTHQRLRHAPEPSLHERLGKWRRRNRSLASASGVAMGIVAVLAFLALGYASWGARLARMEAEDTRRRFTAEAQMAQILLFDRNADRAQLEEGRRMCEAALARYRVHDRPDWPDARIVGELPPGDRDSLREEVGRLLFVLARVTAQQATLDAGWADPQPALHRALLLNDAALACYVSGQEPRVVWELRAELARLQGRSADARRLAQQAVYQPITTWSDRFLLAYQYAGQKEHRKALPLLRDLTSEAPDNVVAWFVQGVCHFELLQDTEAVGCFNSCIALHSDCHLAWHHRGLAAQRLRRFDEARSDFDRVVALKPDDARGYMNRAVAHHELNDYSGEIDDLTRALDLGGPPTSILFRRSAAHRAAGEAAAADRDLELVVRTEPNDEDGLIDRGLSRAATDPEGARADFDAAVRLNPRSVRGLQSKAALLAGKHRQGAAVQK